VCRTDQGKIFTLQGRISDRLTKGAATSKTLVKEGGVNLEKKGCFPGMSGIMNEEGGAERLGKKGTTHPGSGKGRKVSSFWGEKNGWLGINCQKKGGGTPLAKHYEKKKLGKGVSKKRRTPFQGKRKQRRWASKGEILPKGGGGGESRSDRGGGRVGVREGRPIPGENARSKRRVKPAGKVFTNQKFPGGKGAKWKKVRW